MDEIKSGRRTMSDAIRTAHRYHRYSYYKIARFLGTRVAEVGCAWGIYTTLLLEDGKTVLGLDLDSECIESCRDRFKGGDASFILGDITSPEALEQLKQFIPDTVLMMQVLEHIEADTDMLSRLRRGCPSGCRLVVCTPAFQSLYGPMDSDAGHFRRYTRKSLNTAIERAGWRLDRSFYVNPVGAMGWWVNNRLFARATSLNARHINSQISLFDKFVLPVSRALDRVTSGFFGQTVISTAFVD